MRAHQRSCSDQIKILKAQSAQTTTTAMSIAYRLWVSFSINRVLKYIYIYIYVNVVYYISCYICIYHILLIYIIDI